MSNDPTETPAAPPTDASVIGAETSVPAMAETGEAKPKRRAPRKTKAVAEAAPAAAVDAPAEVAASVPPEATGAEGEAAAAPAARKTPRRRKAAAAAEPAEAAPTVQQPAGEHVAEAPVATGAAELPAAESAVPGSVPAEAQPAAASAENAESAEVSSSPASAEEGAMDAAEQPSGRRRRDRRERRGGDKAAERSAAGDAAPTVEGAEASEEAAGEPRRAERAPQGAGESRRRKDGTPGKPGGDAQPVRAASERFAEVLSGQFDDEQPEDLEDEAPGKRVLAPEPEAPKLHKVLAQAGIGSRRDMEQFILEGRISVNGEPAHIGQRISYGDQVRINGKPIKFRIAPPAPRLLAYHKPVGEVVTHSDPEGRPTVFRRLPRLPNGKWQSVGRLDLNTEGLLLFTNSGELANQLMHPRFGVEREYAVRVLGSLNEEARAKLLEGVKIDGQAASFKSIEDGGGDGANRWYRVVITEGRNREVRKLFEAVGMAVSRLIRIRYGTVVLPRGLKRGVWVELEGNDVRTIRHLAGGDAARPAAAEEAGGKPGAGRGGKRGGGPQPGPKGRGGQGPRPNNGPAQPGPGGNRRGAGKDNREGRENRAPKFIGPDPLEQTYDKRFAQSTLARQTNPNRQPDPMQTSVGYIGGDAFYRKGQGGKGGGRGGRGGGGGGGGNFGGAGGFGGGQGNRGNRGGRGR